VAVGDSGVTERGIVESPPAAWSQSRAIRSIGMSRRPKRAGALVEDGAVEGKEPLGFVDAGVDAVLHLQEVSEPAAGVARSVAP
jgi:hypothetical protein